MDEDQCQAAAVWASTALDGLAASGFAQVDLDDLTGVSLDPLLAIDVMRVALRATAEVDPDVQGLVVLPLEPSGVPRRSCPEWPVVLTTFERHRAALTVPGIYLMAAGHTIAPEEDGDYTVLLSHVPKLGPDISATYREWRTQHDRAAGLDYNRAIYLGAHT